MRSAESSWACFVAPRTHCCYFEVHRSASAVTAGIAGTAASSDGVVPFTITQRGTQIGAASELVLLGRSGFGTYGQ